MLQVGLSTEIVEHKMVNNGDDPRLLNIHLANAQRGNVFVAGNVGDDGSSSSSSSSSSRSNISNSSSSSSSSSSNSNSSNNSGGTTGSRPGNVPANEVSNDSPSRDPSRGTGSDSKSTITSSTVSPMKAADLGKYYKMLNMGLPVGAVQQKMTKDGIDPSLLVDPTLLPKKKTKEKGEAKEMDKNNSKLDNSKNPKYTKYFKMLNMGIPRGAVENKMKQDGIDPSILDGAILTVPKVEETAAATVASASATKKILMKDSERYSRYFKMLKMGIPRGAVKNKMEKDGVDPLLLDLGPDAAVPITRAASKSTPTTMQTSNVLLKDSTKYGKYFKMLKMRIPAGAVKNKMEQDGVDPSILDLGPDAFEPLDVPITAQVLLLKDDTTFTKYFKMLDVGLPPPAVKHRMVQDQVDPKVLDMDPNGPSPNQPHTGGGSSQKMLLPFATLTDSPAKKKKKKKPKGDGLVRKKIHWRKLSGLRLTSSMWGSMGAADANKFGLAAREIKEMTALFCQSMNPQTGAGSPGRGRDLGASQQGARNGSSLKQGGDGGSGGKKKKTTLLDMTRANNISIVLARFDDVSLTKITRSVCSLDASGMSSEHLRSLLGLAPTTIEAETLAKYDGSCSVLDLGKAERFCMALMRIPRYQERIRCFMYVLRFQEIIKDLRQDLTVVSVACDRVVASTALARALEVLMALGNFLNLYSVNGEAEGVMIDSLNKLKQVKSYGSQTTALHYFTLVVQDRSKDIFNLSSEVGDCRGASGVVLSQLTAELNILRKGFVQLQNELKQTKKMVAATVASSSTTLPERENMKDISTLGKDEMNLIFDKALESFLSMADTAIQEVETMEKSAVSKFEHVKVYYGEFEATQPEQFFSSLANFLVDFEQARRDNEDSRARSKKKKMNKQKQKKRELERKKRGEERARRKSMSLTSAGGTLRKGSKRAPPAKANTPPALKSKLFL